MIWWQQIGANLDWLVHFKAPVYSFIPSASEARMLLTSAWRKGTSHMRVRVSSEEGYKHPSYVLRLSERKEGWKAGRLPTLLSSDSPRWARYLGVTCSESHWNPIVLVLMSWFYIKLTWVSFLGRRSWNTGPVVHTGAPKEEVLIDWQPVRVSLLCLLHRKAA